MRFSELIIESREDDFKKKYSKKFLPQNIEKIVKMVTPKYLEWVGKIMDEINFDESFPKLVTGLNSFDSISTNLPLTDINQYKTLNELLGALNTYDNRVRRDVKEVKGGKVVFDDGKYFVVNPLNHESSCYYGTGTKWCTAAESDTHFKRYNEDGKLFYIIDRTKPTNNPFYKVALLKKFDGEMSFWDAEDNQIRPTDVLVKNIIGEEKYNEIMSSVNKFLGEVYSEQLKIYADKAAAQKEKQRLEKLRIDNELQEKKNDAQDRREEGEWDGEYDDMSDEGVRAHALLTYIEQYESVGVMTNEDRVEITRLETEIDRLKQEYDDSEDPRPELLDGVYELEEELNELKNKIDVYDIIPTGGFYECTEFEVLTPDLQDRLYVVGDEDEMKTSAYDNIDELIDDFGYQGFNMTYVSNYIDTDAVVSYAEEFFDNDVRASPESYFNEDQRELSGEQEEQIRIRRNFIERTELQISNLDEKLDGGEDDDDIQEKIDELNEMIQESEDMITEIEENPEGDFPEDLIEDIVNDRLRDVRRDPEDFISEWGLELENFIDRRDFINGVVEEDGYGSVLNRYDGSVDEVKVGDTWFYVMRID